MRISTDFASVEFFYSLACFTFILSGVFCAVVRWCHMCHPFDERGDFFYPARRQMTFLHLVLSRLFCHGVSSLFPNGEDEAQLVFCALFLFAFLVVGDVVPHGAILADGFSLGDVGGVLGR